MHMHMRMHTPDLLAVARTLAFTAICPFQIDHVSMIHEKFVIFHLSFALVHMHMRMHTSDLLAAAQTLAFTAICPFQINHANMTHDKFVKKCVLCVNII